MTDEGTLPPPSSSRAEVAVLTADAGLSERLLRGLRGNGFWVVAAASLSELATVLPNDVLVLDSGDRAQARTILEVLSRVPTRPNVVVILRDHNDLRLAIQYSVGVIAIDTVDEHIADAVDRALRNRRRPRLGAE